MEKHILVTNDDGVLAPGLLALVQEMRKYGKVSILGPDRNWSGGGHVKTLDRALRVKEVQLADGTLAYASDGAPSDCVSLAALGYFKEPVDLVVSGINVGANLGHDVTYSGTVTAAMEAVIGACFLDGGLEPVRAFARRQVMGVAAEQLGLARGTLAFWAHRWHEDCLEARPLGRPWHRSDPQLRSQAVDFMRYAGPRMILRHPILAVLHQLDGFLHRRPNR